jgi:hypothetical protein
MGKKLVGLLFLLCGIAVFVGAIAAEIAWLGFCFGTVIIGILLLFLAPPILIFPVTLGFMTGMAIWGAGIVLISGDEGEALQKSIRRYNSLEPGEVDDRVRFFVQLQISELMLRKEQMVIDTIVVAYLTAVVNIITRKNVSLSGLKPMCHGLFPKSPFLVDMGFSDAVNNNAEYRASVPKFMKLVRDEVASGHGTFLVQYVIQHNLAGDAV